MIQKKWILPVFRAVTYCRAINAAFAVHARPCAGIGMALIARALELAGVDSENHVKIRRKIFQRVPLFVEFDGRSDAFESRKFRIVDDEIGRASCRERV